nr:DUF6415 family natural product biosynthesis protein [Streptomyces sp. JB150]
METLTLRPRGHLMPAIPAVEGLACRFPEDAGPRARAHAVRRCHLGRARPRTAMTGRANACRSRPTSGGRGPSGLSRQS